MKSKNFSDLFRLKLIFYVNMKIFFMNACVIVDDVMETRLGFWIIFTFSAYVLGCNLYIQIISQSILMTYFKNAIFLHEKMDGEKVICKLQNMLHTYEHFKTK